MHTKRIITLALTGAAVALPITACGGSTTQTQTAKPQPQQAQTQPTSPKSAAESQNDQTVKQAAQSSDNQAQLGATAIRQILVKKLGMDHTESFNLNHHIEPDAISSQCYVKTGAEAVSFEDQSENILYAPNGKDLIFVQSDTATPLVKCLQDVRTALHW